MTGSGDLEGPLSISYILQKSHSCLFETKPQTVESFIKQLEDNFRAQHLTFGGFIAVLGGSVDIIGCTCESNMLASFPSPHQTPNLPSSMTHPRTGSFVRFRPLGNPSFFEISVGRDILTIAGTINVVGSFYFNMQLFRNKLSVGGLYAVMGGTMNLVGFAISTITGFNSQWGAGLQTYVGACVRTRAIVV